MLWQFVLSWRILEVHVFGEFANNRGIFCFLWYAQLAIWTVVTYRVFTLQCTCYQKSLRAVSQTWLEGCVVLRYFRGKHAVTYSMNVVTKAILSRAWGDASFKSLHQITTHVVNRWDRECPSRQIHWSTLFCVLAPNHHTYRGPITVVSGTKSNKYRKPISSGSSIWIVFPYFLALWWFNDPSNLSDRCLYACYACVPFLKIWWYQRRICWYLLWLCSWSGWCLSWS